MILIGTNDPGPFAYLIKLSRYLEDLKWVNNKIIRNHNHLNSVTNWKKTKPKLIITGTSIGYKLDKKLVKFGKENNIPTIVCIESWENINQRFTYKRKKYHPNYVIVNDKIAYNQCTISGLDKSTLFIGGNPLLEDLHKKKHLKLKPLIKKGRKNICFISEPFSETSRNFRRKYKFDEFTSLNDLINIIDFKKYNLTIKLHPKDSEDKYSNFLNSNIKIKKIFQKMIYY